MTKLQEFRKQKDLSQFELAKNSGVSIQLIQKYEQGVLKIENCRLDNLIRISSALGISFVDLFDDSNFVRRVGEQLFAQPVQHAER